MSEERRFPVHGHSRERLMRQGVRDCPRDVPWSLLAPHEAQAVRNHDQTLQRLAERGGLSPAEMVAVIEGRGLRWILLDGATDETALPMLLRHIAVHAAAANPTPPEAEEAR